MTDDEFMTEADAEESTEAPRWSEMFAVDNLELRVLNYYRTGQAWVEVESEPKSARDLAVMELLIATGDHQSCDCTFTLPALMTPDYDDLELDMVLTTDDIASATEANMSEAVDVLREMRDVFDSAFEDSVAAGSTDE